MPRHQLSVSRAQLEATAPGVRRLATTRHQPVRPGLLRMGHPHALLARLQQRALSVGLARSRRATGM